MDPTPDDHASLLDLAVELDDAIATHLNALAQSSAGELAESSRADLLASALSTATVLRSLQQRAASLNKLDPALRVAVPMTVLGTLQSSLLVMYDREIDNALALSQDEFDGLVGAQPLRAWVAALQALAETPARSSPIK